MNMNVIFLITHSFVADFTSLQTNDSRISYTEVCEFFLKRLIAVIYNTSVCKFFFLSTIQSHTHISINFGHTNTILVCFCVCVGTVLTKVKWGETIGNKRRVVP